MSNNIMTPAPVVDKLNELNRIVEEYPDCIPLGVCAEFLGAKPSSIRSYLETAKNPFGMFWKEAGAANRAFKIPTVKFYLWYTNGEGFRKEA